MESEVPAMRLPRVQAGDLFSVELTNGVGFIQCVNEAEKTGVEIIRAISGTYDSSESVILSEIVIQKEIFFSLLPLKYALKKSLISFVGNFTVPIGSEAPRFFRAKHVVRSNFLGWFIVERETLQHKLVQTLSPEESSLSQWGTISIPDLVERIENHWTPAIWK